MVDFNQKKIWAVVMKCINNGSGFDTFISNQDLIEWLSPYMSKKEFETAVKKLEAITNLRTHPCTILSDYNGYVDGYYFKLWRAD